MSASSIRKIEDLPSDGGRVVDTLAGAILRIFVRLEAIEEAQARLARRLAALERNAAPLHFDQSAAPKPLPPAPAKRGRGRPPLRPRNGQDLTPGNDDAAQA
jgi:hypothetical protein